MRALKLKISNLQIQKFILLLKRGSDGNLKVQVSKIQIKTFISEICMVMTVLKFEELKKNYFRLFESYYRHNSHNHVSK